MSYLSRAAAAIAFSAPFVPCARGNVARCVILSLGIAGYLRRPRTPVTLQHSNGMFLATRIWECAMQQSEHIGHLFVFLGTAADFYDETGLVLAWFGGMQALTIAAANAVLRRV